MHRATCSAALAGMSSWSISSTTHVRYASQCLVILSVRPLSCEYDEKVVSRITYTVSECRSAFLIWTRGAVYNPRTFCTETAYRMPQCTLWKDFIRGVGPRVDHAYTVELRPSCRASDGRLSWPPARSARRSPVNTSCMNCYLNSDDPWEPSGAAGRARGASGEASDGPDGTPDADPRSDRLNYY